uniref:Uncharacterized protein n=1 Tax=Arundo donax TaxID=35708 RepID=A0A0A8YA59_ARUDO
MQKSSFVCKRKKSIRTRAQQGEGEKSSNVRPVLGEAQGQGRGAIPSP